MVAFTATLGGTDWQTTSAAFTLIPWSTATGDGFSNGVWRPNTIGVVTLAGQLTVLTVASVTFSLVKNAKHIIAEIVARTPQTLAFAIADKAFSVQVIDSKGNPVFDSQHNAIYDPTTSDTYAIYCQATAACTIGGDPTASWFSGAAS